MTGAGADLFHPSSVPSFEYGSGVSRPSFVYRQQCASQQARYWRSTKTKTQYKLTEDEYGGNAIQLSMLKRPGGEENASESPQIFGAF